MSQEQAARAAAHAYVECINSKALERLLGLFAENAILQHPFGEFAGKQKLQEFYGGIVMQADTQLTLTKSVTEGNACVIQVTGVSPQAKDKPQFALDLFEVNAEGLIQTLAIYYLNS